MKNPVLLEEVMYLPTAPQHRKIVRDLMERPHGCPPDRLMDQLWPINASKDPPDGMNLVLNVLMCRLKGELKPGWKIERIDRRLGWRLIYKEKTDD